MAVRAVIFDYGMVLSNAQEPAAYTKLLEITGLPRDTFEPHYWRYRLDYDQGTLNGRSYWARLGQDAGILLTPEQIESLIENDVLMWATVNEQMLAWVEALQKAGVPTAILSNMGEDLLRYMRQEFAWLAAFDHHTWSCEVGLIKPDPAIYTWTCEKIGVPPQEALFLDDRAENVEAAKTVGLYAIQFRNVDQLRVELESTGLLNGLPLPDPEPTVRNSR
ncbi:HAD family hydrolase [Paracidobacterium acidisoli]|uniref:HAD family phosphatase n=1 Tax=Paracidobacterium acidisoli TaxID=2303751 RepID=A0A372ISR7_9BACT|nr:HAD family phosphatase [Paracidobacterium acidisoli]MBT9330435.1 HAD family phosphatase [Paracidobacterium acidisoli]